MWQVGKRQAFERTDFGYKVVIRNDHNRVGIKVNGVNGEIVADVKNDIIEDTDENVRVQVDRVYIKAMKRRYYYVVVFEPVLLVGGICCTAGWILWYWNRY